MSHLNKQIWAHPCYINNELKQYLYYENIFISLSLDDNIKEILHYTQQIGQTTKKIMDTITEESSEVSEFS